MENVKHLSQHSVAIYEETLIAQTVEGIKKDRLVAFTRMSVFLLAAGAILAVSLYLSISLEPLLLKVLGGQP